MSRRADATGRTAATPWPILVAVGLAVSELGIFVGSVPGAVSGLVLFGGAVAGLAHEAGRGASPVGPLVVVGGLLVAVGGGVWVYGAGSTAVPTLLAAPGVDGLARRGMAILAAGGVLVAVGGVGLFAVVVRNEVAELGR